MSYKGGILAGVICFVCVLVIVLIYSLNRILPPHATDQNDLEISGTSQFSYRLNRMDGFLMILRILFFTWFFLVAFLINWSRQVC